MPNTQKRQKEPFVVHCPIKTHWKIVNKVLEKKYGVHALRDKVWEEYKEESCITSKGTFGYRNFYEYEGKDRDYGPVIDSEKFLKNKETLDTMIEELKNIGFFYEKDSKLRLSENGKKVLEKILKESYGDSEK